MKSTNFENTTGLDDTTVNHKTSALDIAIMSKALLSHEIILKYSSVWQDTIRNGEFVLTNTNRLVRFYDGCTGLKTGSTSSAGFCMSATAERNGMHLIAVVMGAKTRDARNTLARELLDFGFLNYSVYSRPSQILESCTVNRGTSGSAMLATAGFSVIVKTSDLDKIEAKYDIPQSIEAPVDKGDAVGKITYTCGGVIIGSEDIVCTDKIEKIDFSHMFKRLILSIFYKLC
jgi:D-alanyl-D-alanine carboxypeptidase (penicillin-binding protein 5/6)